MFDHKPSVGRGRTKKVKKEKKDIAERHYPRLCFRSTPATGLKMATRIGRSNQLERRPVPSLKNRITTAAAYSGNPVIHVSVTADPQEISLSAGCGNPHQSTNHIPRLPGVISKADRSTNYKAKKRDRPALPSGYHAKYLQYLPTGTRPGKTTPSQITSAPAPARPGVPARSQRPNRPSAPETETTQSRYGDPGMVYRSAFAPHLVHKAVQLSHNSSEYPLISSKDATAPPIVPRKRKRDTHVPVMVTGRSKSQIIYQRVQDNCGNSSNAENTRLHAIHRKYDFNRVSHTTLLDDLGANDAFRTTSAPPSPKKARKTRTAADKRGACSTNWNDLLPRLVIPFGQRMSRVVPTRDGPAPTLPSPACAGGTCPGPSDAQLQVTCVFMKYVEDIFLDVCECCPAALQLLNRGLFPSAPIRPTLAVELDQLDLVSTMFKVGAPNITDWTETLRLFLARRGYVFPGQDTLRRRYGKALQYYQVLAEMCHEVVNNAIESARQRLCENASEIIPHSFESLAADPITRSYFASDKDHEPSFGGSRPSPYLRARCPLCFGSDQYQCDPTKPDVQFSGDGCFTQSRYHDQHGARDFPLSDHLPRTIFVSRDECDAMDAYVTSKRKQPKPKVDHESGIAVANEVLDLCGDSFRAADEKRAKSSKKRFDDTGLMALVCRHDRVLWLANMTEAGEKQYYMLVLLDKVFKELPSMFTVGFLYDVACQLHRSMAKWQFLPHWFDRIHFAIPALHAYGHQWICQITYHPHKIEAFGRTDGEGTERFWSHISDVIKVCRVSGFNQRLYILNAKVSYLDSSSLWRLGAWLQRRYRLTLKKITEAEDEMDRLNISTDQLEHLSCEWGEAKAHHHTQVPSRGKRGLERDISSLLELRDSLSFSQAHSRKIRRRIAQLAKSGDVGDVLQERNDELRELSKQEAKISAKLKVKEDMLLSYEMGKSMLETMSNSKLYANIVTLRGTQRQLQNILRERKHSYVRQARHIHNHLDHAGQEAAKREKKMKPRIYRFIRKFNTLVEQILRDWADAPNGWRPPVCLTLIGIFQLDHAHPIHQTFGPPDDFGGPLPRWQSDESFLEAVHAMHVLNGSKQEFRVIERETRALRVWACEENVAILHALKEAERDVSLFYQLTQRHLQHAALIERWRADTSGLPVYGAETNWPIAVAPQAWAVSEETGDHSDVDSDAEDLIRPCPLNPIPQVLMEAIDAEDEKSDLDSDASEDVDF